MRLAILGASGVAGRALIRAAGARGHALATDRVDVCDAAGLERQFRGAHAVVNLATSIPRPGGRGDWAVNDRIRREGTATVVDACVRAGVRVLVQQSVAMLHCVADQRPQVEDDPVEGYGVLASAMEMERQVRGAPIDGRLVRGALFAGPETGREEQWAADLASPDFRVPGDGRGWMSLVHVEDYAEALLVVLERGRPKAAYIASDEPMRWQDLYSQLAARAGVNAPLPGGPERLRSFRVSNERLRGLGWQPRPVLATVPR
jgi:nucleoside-diphosphate-sugar epimerase